MTDKPNSPGALDRLRRRWAVLACLLCLTAGLTLGHFFAPRQADGGMDKVAFKEGVLEALAERFPIFGPRGDKIDLEEERRRRDADPIGTLEFELWAAQRDSSQERVAGAARDFHAAGADREALDRFLDVVRQELDAAELRGGQMYGGRGR